MNEQIRQLAEQAYLYQEHDTFLTAALEHFAQLIVAECARVADATSVSGPPRGCTYGNVILEHFGVKS